MPATTYDIQRLAARIPAAKKRRSVWKKNSIQLLEFEESFVRVRAAGRGKKTVILALDPPNVVEQGDEFIAALQDNFRVIIFEQPGFGFSYPKAGFDFTRPAYANMLEKLLLHFRQQAPFMLCFPCFSIYYGMEIASRRPDLIERAVFMQGASWQEEKKWVDRVADAFTLLTLNLPFVGRYIMGMPYLGQWLGARIEPTFPKKTHPFVVFRGLFNREMTARFVGPGQKAFAEGACNCMQSFYQNFFREKKLPDFVVTQPVRFVWAGNDFSHRKSRRDGLAPFFKDVTYHTVPRCGHHLELEKPGEVAKLIRGWV